MVVESVIDVDEAREVRVAPIAERQRP